MMTRYVCSGKLAKGNVRVVRRWHFTWSSEILFEKFICLFVCLALWSVRDRNVFVIYKGYRFLKILLREDIKGVKYKGKRKYYTKRTYRRLVI